MTPEPSRSSACQTRPSRECDRSSSWKPSASTRKSHAAAPSSYSRYGVIACTPDSMRLGREDDVARAGRHLGTLPAGDDLDVLPGPEPQPDALRRQLLRRSPREQAHEQDGVRGGSFACLEPAVAADGAAGAASAT